MITSVLLPQRRLGESNLSLLITVFTSSQLLPSWKHRVLFSQVAIFFFPSQVPAGCSDLSVLPRTLSLLATLVFVLFREERAQSDLILLTRMPSAPWLGQKHTHTHTV